MRDKIKSTKDSVKSHFDNHRAKYAYVAGIATGAVVTSKVHKCNFDELMENVENVTEIATEM